MDENRTDLFSNTPENTAPHGADSAQPPVTAQTPATAQPDSVAAPTEQEQETAAQGQEQSQPQSEMPSVGAEQMREQATQYAQQTVHSFYGTQNPNGCTYSYGRAQQPQAQPKEQPSAAGWGTPQTPVYNTAPRTSAQSSASAVKPQQPAADKKKAKKQKKEKTQKSRMSIGQFVLCVVLCLAVSVVSGYVSSKSAVRDLLNEYMETFSTAENTTGSYNVNIFEQPVAPTDASAQQTQGNTEAATVPVVNASASDIYKQNVNAVVNITAVGHRTVDFGFFFGSQTREFTSSGTGFFITEDGYILTNYHVVEGTEKLTVTDFEGNEYSATLIGFEESNDIAVIKVSGTFQAVQLGSSETLEVGDTLLIIGNALGELQYTLTQGVVSYLERAVTTETGDVINMFQTDAAINSGNSGGPVFNAKGEVVGIASAKYASGTIEGLGFCIPVDDVKNMISDIIDVGYVTGKPSLGVSLYTNSGRSNGLPNGCYVVAVGYGSACFHAGVSEGDVITAIAGETVRETDDVATILSEYKAGDSITLTVYSTDSRTSSDVTVTLDEYVPAEARTEYTNVYDF